jgi:hypothetical protein
MIATTMMTDTYCNLRGGALFSADQKTGGGLGGFRLLIVCGGARSFRPLAGADCPLIFAPPHTHICTPWAKSKKSRNIPFTYSLWGREARFMSFRCILDVKSAVLAIRYGSKPGRNTVGTGKSFLSNLHETARFFGRFSAKNHHFQRGFSAADLSLSLPAVKAGRSLVTRHC